MKRKTTGFIALALTAAVSLSACGGSTNVSAATDETNRADTQTSAIQTETAALQAEPSAAQTETSALQAETLDASVSTDSFADAFSSRDLAGTWDAASAISIALNGTSISSDSGAVTVSGSVATITAAGTYRVTGTLSDGSLIVDAAKEDKVQIVLDNASIHSETFAAIYVKQADKVFVTLADGTENTLSNGGTFESADENNVDGVIFSKDDLTLNGGGKLVVNSPAKHGVVCKDDLTITGGTYEITAASHAISAKDSFSVADGTFTLTAGKDGVHVENSEDTERGNVYIASGTMSVTADGDGVSASGMMRVDGGTFAIKAGGGAQNAKVSSDESRKGLKADGNLILMGGAFAIDAADDGIHSNADIEIAGGNYAIAVGDDGIHADGLTQIDGGALDINAYEGIEGTYVRINNGTVNIYASDDGINAARKSSAYSPTIEINGGDISVTVGQGDTDCIDANGNLIITGGTVSVTGNSGFDVDGSVTFTGGTVIINGQQVDTIPTQMMGGRGGRGGFGGGMNGRGNFAAPNGNANGDTSGAVRGRMNGGANGGTRQFNGGQPNELPDATTGATQKQEGAVQGKNKAGKGRVKIPANTEDSASTLPAPDNAAFI